MKKRLYFFLGFALLLDISCGGKGEEKTEIPASSSATKAGLVLVGKNQQGYEEYKNEKSGLVFMKIRAGKFRMGTSAKVGETDERPAHDVYLDEYYISKYEVSNQQYKVFCDSTGRAYPRDPNFQKMPDYFNKFPDYPAVNVTWEDAKAYCEWAGFRLPTEAEWAKAAKGSSETGERTYPWGNEEPGADGTYRCNMFGSNPFEATLDGYQNTAPVNQYDKGLSAYGCYQMAGNVWEWCADWYAPDYYKKSPQKNPLGPANGTDKVMRGGSWSNEAGGVRVSNRDMAWPAEKLGTFGFRPAATAEDKEPSPTPLP